jgi:hypothetical protein
MTMTAAPPGFLSDLKRAAEQASVAEDALRRDIAARIKALETERAVAFRRFNLMAAVTDAVAAAPDRAAAVAAASVVLRQKLGWASDSAVRDEVVERFAAVAQAVATEVAPPEGEDAPAPDVITALAAFELWYAASHETSFWVLFETYMPETPRVDF